MRRIKQQLNKIAIIRRNSTEIKTDGTTIDMNINIYVYGYNIEINNKINYIL